MAKAEMKLRMVLDIIEDKTQKIKIGADNGSSFFYVGTVEDFTANESKYEQADISYYDNCVKSAEDNLDALLNADTSFSGYAKAQYRKWVTVSARPNFSTSAYSVFLENHAHQLMVKFDSLIKERKNRLERLVLMERPVTQKFNADITVEPDGVIVLSVKGNEIGAFWTTDEADGPQIKFGRNNDSE